MGFAESFRSTLCCCLQAGVRLRPARLDLRFQKPDDEAAYVASHEEFGLWFVVIAAGLACTFQGLNDGQWLMEEISDETNPLDFSPDDYRFYRIMLFSSDILFSALLLVLARIRLAYRARLCWLPYEWMVSALVLKGFCAVLGSRTWNYVVLGKAWGQLPDLAPSVEDACLETRALLQFIGIITAISLVGPARAHLLSLIVVLSFFAYVALIFGVGTPMVGECLGGQLLAIAIIIGFAVAGAWQKEQTRRKEWLQGRALQLQEQELQGASSMARGMRAITQRVCDMVFALDTGLRVSESDQAHETFFGRPIVGSKFSSLVSLPDQERFTTMMSLSSESHLPHCIRATLQGRRGDVEAEILAVETEGQTQWIIGTRLESVTEHFGDGACGGVEAEDMGASASDAFPADAAAASPRSELGAAGLASDVASIVQSVALQSPLSVERFRNMDFSQIEELGRTEHWWVDPSDLHVTMPTRVLGHGSFGQVIMATLNGKAVAVKTTRADPSGESLISLANELRVMRHMRHPNLVQLYGAIIDRTRSDLALVFELVGGVSLGYFIPQFFPLSARDQVCILSDVACALWYLHRQHPPIVHSDIKPGNVMVQQSDGMPRTKVIDFGLSSVVTRNEKLRGCSAAWVAPEILRNPQDRPRASSDVFSFGLLMYFVAGGAPLHQGEGHEISDSLRRMIETGHVDLPGDAEGAQWPGGSRDLCQACLDFQVYARPDMNAVCSGLKASLSSSEDCDLSVEASFCMLPSIAWKEKPAWPCAGQVEDGFQGAVRMPLQVDLSEHAVVTFAGEGADAIFGPQCVGKSFLDFVVDPEALRLVMRAGRYDARRGGARFPWMLTLTGLGFNSPGGEGRPLDAMVQLLIPDGSGRWSVRILSLRHRKPEPQRAPEPEPLRQRPLEPQGAPELQPQQTRQSL